MVVGQHSAWILSWPPDSVVRRVLADVLDNSTVLFVFLSGFLFAHLHGRHSYRAFLWRRATTVVAPYLIVVAPAAALAVWSPQVGGRFTDIAGRSAVIRFGWFLLHGTTMVNLALWFIPMITLYYLLAPLFGAFVRWPRLYWLLLVLVPLSLLAHRPAVVPHADTLALGAYYASAYVLGMFVCRYRRRLADLGRVWWALAVCYLLGLLADILFDPYHGNYEGVRLFSQEHGLFDWVYAQKLLLCVALLAVTQRFAHRLTGLTYLGFASFSVYLLHCYLVNAIRPVLDRLGIAGSLAAWAATVTAALAGSLALVALTRRVLGGRSLYVIGSADRPGATDPARPATGPPGPAAQRPVGPRQADPRQQVAVPVQRRRDGGRHRSRGSAARA